MTDEAFERDKSVSRGDDLQGGPHARPRPWVFGTVRASSGEPIEGAGVDAVPGDDVHCRVTRIGILTGRDGRYRQRNIRCGGTWVLIAAAEGYKPQQREIKVPDEGKVEVDFELNPA